MSEPSSNETQSESTYEPQDLQHHSELGLLQMNAQNLDLLTHQLSQHLERSQLLMENLRSLAHLQDVAESLRLLLETTQQTTPVQPSDPTQQPSVEPPRSEIPAGADGDFIVLPDGRSVPSSIVRALTEYNEGVWPGAVLPEARAAIASVVIREIEGNQAPVLRTSYPFCLDPNPGNLSYESPCILRADHPGKHHDNNDGVW